MQHPGHCAGTALAKFVSRPEIVRHATIIFPTAACRSAVLIGVAVMIAALPIAQGSALARTIEPPPMSSIASHPYAPHVAEAARRFGIPKAWIWAVMRVESAGNARAISPAGAMGLMQIMPTTWAQLRARYGLGADPYDVRDNIMAGAAYLREMYDRYDNVSAMLAAYNAGPSRYDEHLRGRPLPTETRLYLARLAPMTGDTEDTQISVALPKDPFAWRRSDLFVRIASAGDAGTSAAISSEDRRPNGASETPIPSDNQSAGTPTAPSKSAPTDTLFVRRTGAGRPQ